MNVFWTKITTCRTNVIQWPTVLTHLAATNATASPDSPVTEETVKTLTNVPKAMINAMTTLHVITSTVHMNALVIVATDLNRKVTQGVTVLLAKEAKMVNFQ